MAALVAWRSFLMNKIQRRMLNKLEGIKVIGPFTCSFPWAAKCHRCHEKIKVGKQYYLIMFDDGSSLRECGECYEH